MAWTNVALIEGELEAFASELKKQEGGTIAVMAGMSLTRQLILAGLVDELTLMVHPVIAGSGRRLFTDETPRTRLNLIRSQQTSQGNMVLTYGKHSQ